jgi:hypothetical protein
VTVRTDVHCDRWDRFTFRRLTETGLAQGWRCLAVGARSDPVAAWLVRRVRPTGAVVVATDIVRHHMDRNRCLDRIGYDLIHARLLLEELPQRALVVRRLAAALRPGGHVVVEDYDARSLQLTVDHNDDWVVVAAAVIGAMRSDGIDLACGHHLGRVLRDAGLVDVSTEGVIYPATLAELAPMIRPLIERTAPALLSSQSISPSQLDRVYAELDGRTNATTTYTPILVSAAARRPADV